MSEQEKKSGSPGTGSTPVVMVSQTSGNRQKQPYRSTELQEEATELHHKRSHAPGVPFLSHDKQKQSLAKKLSSSTKKYDTAEQRDYETITLAPLKVETKVGQRIKPIGKTLIVKNPSCPTLDAVKWKKLVTAGSSPELDAVLAPKIPANQLDLAKDSSGSHMAEKSAEQKAEEESIKDEVVELTTPETAKKQLEWSDDEEAGGLPRSDSRASRISRTVRQFFCCGVPYEAPSEDDVSTGRCVSGI
ncbi:unnamed protein product, partial [Iphiclides podalirius]